MIGISDDVYDGFITLDGEGCACVVEVDVADCLIMAGIALQIYHIIHLSIHLLREEA